MSEGSSIQSKRILPLVENWDWQARALCQGMDSAVFFHPDGERGYASKRREQRAKALCQLCPVQAMCRTHALNAREPYGIWGGLSESERARLLEAVDSTPVRTSLKRR
ncbi:WhiB family transcriptional regulator [Mycolicibacterium sp. CR10]|uniref:WhiB family transcriptional regulator n=1 Tax=Mycolicibacterium sp. CR10 TaxID=2562314 RepID=UPI0010C07825|nr:WhiB family transcriptional regulator [Mycolicibacterium sp. CR10]